MNPGSRTTSGWTISYSICMELDTVLHLLLNQRILGTTIPDFNDLLAGIPLEWLDELHDIFGKENISDSLLETLAVFSGVILEDDYSRASMVIREMNLPTLLTQITALSGIPGEKPNDQTLAILVERFYTVSFSAIQMPFQPGFPKLKAAELGAILPILRGGESHDRFWHWLDRLYYEIYLPWRRSRQPVMDELVDQAQAMLGSTPDGVPPLMWLSEKNPLLRYPELRTAVEDGRLRVHFWVEPFALADSWLLLPGEVIVSFAQPGELYLNFYRFAEKLADRMQALADPTRLVILRLIRNIGMNNTDMAEFLQISRPTVSIHARVLREAGLIRSHAEGRITRHEIIPGELDTLFQDLRLLLDLSDPE